MDDNSTEVQTTTTDANGRFELPSGTDGIVTASKSGLTTIAAVERETTGVGRSVGRRTILHKRS